MAFEPHARTFKLLQLNAELANNIVVANSGASDRKEVAQASEDPLNSGTASVVRSGATEARTGKRPATTFNLDRVDDLIPVADHGNVSFIKIDTEGYELQGLRGMPSILRSSKPVVALEVLKESFDNGKSGAVEYLRELGYSSFYIFREAGWVTLLPKGVRRFLQRIGQATIGRSGYVVELQLAPDLEVRHHSIVLASPFPLKIRR